MSTSSQASSQSIISHASSARQHSLFARLRLAQSMLAMTCVCAGTQVIAQTCASPLIWPYLPDTPLIVNTCFGEQTQAGFCNGNYDSPGPVIQIRLHYDSACFAIQQINMDGTAPAFTPVMYLSASPNDCGQGECLAAASVDLPLVWSGYPTGDYTLSVTADQSDQSGACGEVTLWLIGQPLDSCNLDEHSPTNRIVVAIDHDPVA